VVDKRVFRTISGPKRDEMVGGCRKMKNDELHNLHSMPNIIRILILWKMRWVMYSADIRDKRNAYNNWMGK
jgi:hypothetical protein